MMGNCHVRFLGELGAVMPLAYPTKFDINRIYSEINIWLRTYLYFYIIIFMIKI